KKMDRARLLTGEVQSERSQAGPRVQDDEVARLGAQLDARCVPTGANRVGAGRCQRTTTAPDACAHLGRSLAIPEDRDRADDLVRARQERERRYLDRSALAFAVEQDH